MSELKQCPFCGKGAYVSQDQASDYESHWTWFAECTGCGAMISSMNTKEQAVNAWNSRVERGVMRDGTLRN